MFNLGYEVQTPPAKPSVVVDINTVQNQYGEVSGIAAATLTEVLSYTVTTETGLYFAKASGSNVATFFLKINGFIVDTQRTYFGNSLNASFDFGYGIKVITNDVVSIDVIHTRPTAGTFNARLQFVAG